MYYFISFFFVKAGNEIVLNDKTTKINFVQLGVRSLSGFRSSSPLRLCGAPETHHDSPVFLIKQPSVKISIIFMQISPLFFDSGAFIFRSMNNRTMWHSRSQNYDRLTQAFFTDYSVTLPVQYCLINDRCHGMQIEISEAENFPFFLPPSGDFICESRL